MVNDHVVGCATGEEIRTAALRWRVIRRAPR